MTEIVVVNSFRGGTGKSTITANLASFLAKSGKRVAIIDSDINSPSIHTVFGLSENDFTDTFSDYLFGKCHINDATYDISSIFGFREDQILLVPASNKLANIAHNVNSKRNQNLLRKAIDDLGIEFKLDYIFIDTHPGVNQEVLLVIALADKILTIIRPDRQDYAGAKVSSEVSEKLGGKSFFILNKVHRKLNQSKVKKSMEENFNINIVGALPFDEEILFAESKYIFALKYPDHKFSQVIKRIASKIFGIKPKEYVEIIYSLLNHINKNKGTISEETLFTRCNLTRWVFDDYVKQVVRRGLITPSRGEDGREFTISQKGVDYLKDYGSIVSLIDNFGL